MPNGDGLRKVPEEMLDSMSGGYIVDFADGSEYPLMLVDDATGELHGHLRTWYDADCSLYFVNEARDRQTKPRMSATVISPAQYKEIFGIDISEAKWGF